MSRNYHAGQFEDRYKPSKLGNWCAEKFTWPGRCCMTSENTNMKMCCRIPTGLTRFIADENGHLLPGIKRNTESPWGKFVMHALDDIPFGCFGYTYTTSKDIALREPSDFQRISKQRYSSIGCKKVYKPMGRKTFEQLNGVRVHTYVQGSFNYMNSSGCHKKACNNYGSNKKPQRYKVQKLFPLCKVTMAKLHSIQSISTSAMELVSVVSQLQEDIERPPEEEAKEEGRTSDLAKRTSDPAESKKNPKKLSTSTDGGKSTNSKTEGKRPSTYLVSEGEFSTSEKNSLIDYGTGSEILSEPELTELAKSSFSSLGKME